MQKEKNAMERLNDLIIEKNSRICAGLDPIWDNIPISLKKEIVEDETMREIFVEEIFAEYCSRYIKAIKDVVPAIKINKAFFEKENLEELYFAVAYEAKKAGLFVIGDINKSDIGGASIAKVFLEKGTPFDAITINPYFGTDGVMPFLKLAKENGKGVFIIIKTSNKSSAEIQDLELADRRKMYEAVADLTLEWAEEVDPEGFEEDEMGYKYPDYPMVGAVVAATYPDQAKKLVYGMDKIFFLVPGYGAQGATADDVACNFDRYQGIGAIVNSSRAIMNAYKNERWKDKYSEETWAEAAKAEAIRATEEINQAINKYYDEYICDVENV